ncbi:hypothetical protein [Streptomyces sp. NBC_00503]|uniref:hypothetical protein n=1 Tax=Streptomyces sp. NBC_00503 TaxID=2903659 RepID=UPI002E81ECBC|nr:hypothetical protein [Streptomyces sp. NBC_00503]WUD82566.1 hypothetical protein OG490_19580 [Streptomyces sp. NBC_00503]
MVAAASLIAYFTTVGLDQADKLASAIGLPVTLLGLAGQVFSLVMAHRTAAPGPDPEYVGGSKISVSRVRGRSRVTLRRQARTGPVPPPATGSHVEGNQVQVDGAGESVVEER